MQSDAFNNRTGFAEAPNKWNTDRPQYVRSSSDLVAIVVMTLSVAASKADRFADMRREKNCYLQHTINGNRDDEGKKPIP